MPLTRAQAKGVDPPKPLVRRKRKPKTNTLSFKEIAADLQTAHDARNHAVDAPAQETRPNLAEAVGKEAGETSARDTRPDASNAAKNIHRPHSADQGAAPVDNRPKPRPLAKNRTNGGGDGPDLTTDRFNLSHRTQPRQSQDRDSQREQPAYDTVPAVEDNEEPEYEFDDMPDTGYFDSKYILAMEEDEGQDPNDPFGPHANYSSPPMRRAPTPDSDDERPHSRRHSVDSPPRRVERPGSEARGVSEERSRSRRHSVDSPPRRVERPGSEARGVSEERRQSFDSPTRRGPTPEYARGRSPYEAATVPPSSTLRNAHTPMTLRAGPAQSLRDVRNSKRAGRPPPMLVSNPPWSPPDASVPIATVVFARRRPNRIATTAGTSMAKTEPLSSESETKKLAVGGRVSPVSDEDDAEDMQDFERAIEENGFDDAEEVTTKKKKAKSKSKSKAGGRHRPAKAKEGADQASGARAASPKRGKGRKSSGHQQLHPGRRRGRAEDGPEGDHASGPVSIKIRECVHDAYDKFIKEVETIAKDYTAPLSAWNVWQRYWAETRDKTRDAGSNPNATCRQALITACGIDDEFTTDMIHNTEAAVVNYREKNGLKKKLQQEMKPVIQTAHMIQKTYGVHVWASSSTLAGRKLCIRGWRRDQEHIFGNIELRKRGMAAQALRPAEGLDRSKSGRDDFRHQWRRSWGFSCFGRESLSQRRYSGEHESDSTKFQMKWNVKFLDVAFESKCRIRNYPPARGYRPYYRPKHDDDDDVDVDDTVMEITSSLPLEEQGAVPLITNLDGTGLAYVKQSNAYDKQLASERKKADKEEKKRHKGRKEKGVRPRSASQEDDRYEDSHPPRRREPSGGHREEYYQDDARRSPTPPTNTFRVEQHRPSRRHPRIVAAAQQRRSQYRRIDADPAPARAESSHHTAQVSRLNPIRVDHTHRRDAWQHSGSTHADSQMREASGLHPPRAPAADAFPRTAKGNDLRRDPPPRHRVESSHRVTTPRHCAAWTSRGGRADPACDASPRADPKTPGKQRGARERQRDGAGFETPARDEGGPVALHKLRFLVGDGKSSSFLATGFERVSQITHADAHTFMWNTERGIFCRIPSNCTPVWPRSGTAGSTWKNSGGSGFTIASTVVILLLLFLCLVSAKFLLCHLY
ncbi:hypothetical protein B0H13DRAFT_2370817 [Mycena leptocephala]|nr:hypothetical protein B0H13DRAFT_2370817 [Mycena leptocephala]